MKRTIPYLKPYRWAMAAAMTALGVSTVCDLLLPTIMSQILNNGIYEKDFAYIARCCGRMFLVCLTGIAAQLIGAWWSNKVVACFCRDLRGELFRRVNAMSFEEFGELGTAALVTRATHDVETVSWVVSDLAGSAIAIPVLFLGGVVLAMGKDVLLSLLMLAFVPLILAVVLYAGRNMDEVWKKSDGYMDKQSGIMRERLRGIRPIRAFDAEKKEHERVAQATHVMAKHIIQANVTMGMIAPLATFLLDLAVVLIVYAGGWRLESGSGLTGGDIFAIVQYVSLVASGVIMGAFSIIMIPHAKVAAERIGQILEARGIADPVARQALTLEGDIRFDHVSFRYEGAEEPALRDITLHIPKGRKAAIIGGTGAGKSTLVSILLGFRTPTEGQVLLDGVPIGRLSRRGVRENIGCVLQNAAIFSGTIRENVAMGDLSAGDEAIWQALETAQARDFVSAFPEGIDHPVKQSGKNLSGGQRQRIGIARALLKKAAIYIFDDSFSALDLLTEAKLRKALAGSIAGKTQIVIGQRVASAMHCDCIFVMDQGRLVDQGTHQELLGRCRVYQEICASQTGGGYETR